MPLPRSERHVAPHCVRNLPKYPITDRCYIQRPTREGGSLSVVKDDAQVVHHQEDGLYEPVIEASMQKTSVDNQPVEATHPFPSN